MSESTSTTETLLDLAAPRQIKLTDRGHEYTLHCRRIQQDDWLKYFNAIVISSQRDGRDLINGNTVDAARLALAEEVLVGAEGYTVEGGREITSLENWQARIPLAHRLKLADVLASARPSTSSELVILAECELVELDVTWGINGQGKMVGFKGLKHFFRTPSQEHHTRYMREASRSFVQGGSRTGRTIYRGAQALLAKLYDELIERVDGYAVGDVALEGAEAIRREMDAHHKVIAAQELFRPQETAVLAEEDAE